MFFRRGVYRLPPYGDPVTVDRVPEEASRDHSQPTSSCSITVEEKGKGEGVPVSSPVIIPADREAPSLLTYVAAGHSDSTGGRRPAPSHHLPGPGLQFLGQLSKLMERLARLERKNLQLQQENTMLQQKIQELETQVSSLQREKNERSRWGRLKRRFRIRREFVRPQENIQITVTNNSSGDTTSQSRI